MAKQTVYLLRHGHSVFQTEFEATGKDPGIIDAGLSELGREQVGGIAKDASLQRFDLIVTSPLTRTIETALGVAANQPDTPIFVHPLVRERLSDSCDIGRGASELSARYPSLDLSHLAETWWHTGPEDDRGIPVESREALAERVVLFREWLTARDEQNIVIVSHSGFLLSLCGSKLANCEPFEWEDYDL